MALIQITQPAVEPVTLEEVKAALHYDNDADDQDLADLIVAAREYVSGIKGTHGRTLITTTLELVLDEFPNDGCETRAIRLPLPPLQSVESIKYIDETGSQVTLDPSLYNVDVDSEPGWVDPGDAGWPATFRTINAVRIRYVAGFPPNDDSPPDPAGTVPKAIKRALILLVGHWKANPDAAGTEPDAVTRLLNAYRLYSWG